MRVLIRTDIGGASGMGHAVRCKVLAHALAQRGAEVAFVTRTEALRAFVVPFQCAIQGTDPASHADVLVYDTTEPFDTGVCLLDTLGSYGGHLICIDRPDALAYFCDLLIMPTLHTPPTTLAALQATFGHRLCAGAEYVMLDTEVTSMTPIPYEQRVDGPIVFCAGGSDPDRVLERIMEWTTNMDIGAEMVFCEGAYASRYTMPLSGHRRRITQFSREHIRTASMVVTTMGVTAYECLYLHTPAFLIGHTDRHCAAAFGLSQTWGLNGGGSVYLGDVRTMDADTFRFLVTSYCGDARTRAGMAARSVGLLDGKGVERVAERILGL